MPEDRKKTILLVEDESLIALATAMAIRKFGYEAIVAPSGEKAVSMAGGADLILMDIDLGKGMDGPSAAQAILAARTVPIVFLTSHSEQAMVEKVRGITRYGYMIKNSGDFVLRSTIEMAFELFEANTRLQDELAVRMKAEEELRDSRNRLRGIFGVVPAGVGMVRDRVIMEANPALCAMTGYAESELFGQSARMLYPSEEEFQYVGREKYRQIAERGTGAVETRWLRKDGTPIDVYLASTPLDAGNLSQGVIFTALNITERKRAESELRESEQYLSTTLQSIGDAVIATDNSGRVTRMNRTAETLTGWGGAEAQGRQLSEVFRIVDADSGQGVADPVAAVLERGETVGLANHTVLVSRDGSRYQIADSAAPIRAGDGSIQGVILVFSDVSARYGAEQAVRESERRFKSIVESSPMGMFLYELDGKGDLIFSGANPAADRILGVSNDAFVGMTIEEAFPPLADTEVPARYKHVAANGGMWKVEQLDYDDRVIKGAFDVVSFQTSPGRMAVMFMDITERKRAEEDLRRKTEELEKYFQTALDMFCIAQIDGTFMKLNPQWGKSLGYRTESLIGRNFMDFVHPDDVASTVEAVGRLGRREEVLNFVNRYRCSNGEYRWIEWRSAMNGGLIYAAARDITERVDAEERIRQLLDEKDLILREVHHRIKNNMSTMTSLLMLQASLSDDERVSQALLEAKGRLQSMGVLYEKLYRSDDLQAMSVRVYLLALIEQIAELYPDGSMVEMDERIEDFPLGVKELSSIGIVVNELISNSMKYAFAGRASGRILVEARRDGCRATIAVTDDGVGLPASVDPATTGSFGLRLVGALAEQLRATLDVERSNGTRFSLTFDIPPFAAS